MSDWSKITLIDGWQIQRDESGYTLTVQAYSASMNTFPRRGEYVPATGPSAAPSEFRKFLFTEVVIRPLTSVGPWIADLTAKAHFTAHSVKSDSLLSQTSVTAGYQDFFVKPSYCRLQIIAGATSSETGRPPGMPDTFVSTFNDDDPDTKNTNNAGEYRWTKWLDNDANTVHANCPFSTRPNYGFANCNVKFMAVTVSFNKHLGDGLEDWASFAGVIKGGFPSWIKIPDGANRWRVWDESFEMSADNDGRSILKIRRVLLGIPSNFKDMKGSRCQWNTSALGSKKWGDLI